MPQMAPLWWEVLFFLFITSFIFMNTIIYYNKIINPKQMSDTKNPNINQFKWKW
uniref:ATP synthase complex subunit 8 n=1 Tax=Leptoglossus membranaceus TaxID=2575657 RepID=A0A4D6X858_9HEMI|nr:ATP synthase F0 subunit 8 [Leptoglossus membranaceus]QCI09355.1 ATP synthase F0 subunit 8 [Leptoglossus membranaceus]